MPNTIKFSDNPNEETAFVETDDGQRNRAVLTAAVDGEIEFPANPNSTKVSVIVDGVKRKAIAVATIAGGGDKHNKGYFVDESALTTAYPTAEAGDYAIVESTDTVWIWDSDNSEWKDSDQKGQVTSVNGQTGDVSLSIPDAVQYSTMPTASADNLGDIVQFIGTTDANYTNGYFYKCVSDGQDPATYSWTRVDVQPAPVIPDPLPSQTGQSGKFLTTDGTDASWSDKPLVNKATGTGAVGISNSAAAQTITGTSAIAINGSVSARAGIKMGLGSVSGIGGIALGERSNVSADGAIQINTKWDTSATNSDANTFKVANANGNFEIMSADGTVPHGRLTNAVVSNTVTIAVADWNGGTTCTKTISGLTATSVVWVAPDNASQSDYLTAGVYASAQTTDTITFTATTTPTSALTVNVIYC